MAGPNGQSPMAWRLCGNQLKLWRTDAGVSRELLGEAARYSADTVKAMEQGVRMPTRQLLEAADELCRAGGKLLAASPYLRREKFPARSQDFMQYEAEAASIWWYEVALVPGILQTEEYAQALISGHTPLLDDETVTERVAARMERQDILYRNPPVAMNFVLYEAALRCPIGGALVYEHQLRRLLELADRRNVSLQVLPFDRAVPAALSGPIIVLESRDHEHVALLEGQSLSHLTSAAEDVSAVRERHGMIRSQALSVAESGRFIEGMVNEL